jgi:solute carrier family 5 (high affinity choline transporter), member 7
MWVMRIGIILVATLATFMGITIKSVYELWFLCSDLVYVVLFPQLFSVVYLVNTNTYGSVCGYWAGVILRLASGEPVFKMPAYIKFPFYDEESLTQRFPFRTLAMIISFCLIIGVSWLSNFLFEKGILRKELDIFKCSSKNQAEKIALRESDTADELSKINSLSPSKYTCNETILLDEN